ncbi:unnamed protein product [Psylliodes chrysocephalus]|uniref:Uncharacterized protein n=1 Tax=Psylliodes chrysocephalus TaxID=3402493 RepID=A0A9P0D4S6_9CUCU|nr:unnamed protein product [Psylliodes chrysocephala]
MSSQKTIAKNAVEEEVFLETINTQLHNDNVEFYEADEEGILSPIPAPSDKTNEANASTDVRTKEEPAKLNDQGAVVEEEIKPISKTKRTKKNNEASTSRELKGKEETADSPDQEQEYNEPAELHNLIKRKQARKHDVNPSSWFQNINKINREKGIEYSVMKESIVLNWVRNDKIKDAEKNPQDKRRESRNQLFKNRNENLYEFFESLAKVESHYCRSSTSKLYLEPMWTSTNELYRFYKENYCVENQKESVSRTVFFNEFCKKNYSIYIPKKDLCDKCIAFKTKNITEEEYNLHQQMKREARDAKEKDKETGVAVFAMDLQAVLLSPKSTTRKKHSKSDPCSKSKVRNERENII